VNKSNQCSSQFGGRDFGVKCELKDFHTGSHEACGTNWKTLYGTPISERSNPRKTKSEVGIVCGPTERR
jgi:hypothetical protein